MSSVKRPPAFGPTQRLQREYAAAINRIVRRVLLRPDGDDLAQWQAQLAQRCATAEVQTACQFLAHKMYQWANIRNAQTWRQAANRSQRSRMLYQMLTAELQRGGLGSKVNALVRQNAQLISTLPLVAAQHLVDEVRHAQQSGARPATIDKMMQQRFPELLTNRVHLISRTETAKASSALTQARCEEIGVGWYVWLTADDQRVRQSHRNFNEVLVPWAHAPDPDALVGVRGTMGRGHAGQFPNCRCTQIPLLTYEDVSWPHRVYWQGSIRHMTLPDFKHISIGVEHRAA